MTEGISQEGQWLAAAARGDVEAQRGLVHFCLAQTLQGVPEFEAASMAEPFARLAAEHGAISDLLLLADVLLLRSAGLASYDQRRAEIARDTALALWDDIAAMGDREALAALAACLTAHADRGDDAASVRLNSVMDGLTAKEAAAVRRAAKQQLQDSTEFWRSLSEAVAQ